MEAWFGPEGRFRKILPGFEFRPGQLQMARFVARGLAEGRRVIVEAGTGIGKTLAYLVPAVLSGRPVLVATGTIALQEQLFRKDVPLLERADLSVSATVLKGRSHYLCLWKWNRWRQAPPLALSDPALYGRLQEWVRQTTTGDRAECDALPEDHPLWPDLTADVRTCMGPRCAFFRDCYLYEARRRKARGFRFPETLEEWISPRWQEFIQRRSVHMPWLKDPLRRQIRDFQYVLNAYYPTVTDPRFHRLGRWLLRAAAAWRYHFRLYRHPLELRLLHRIIRYQRPETSGF